MCAKLGLTIFRKRINIERRILRMINETMTLSDPLTGLTEKAVSAWEVHVHRHYNAQQVENLIKLIN